MTQTLTVSAPGRICLLGEHQDYLGLPVITAAINLRIRLHGSATNDDRVRLHLPDLKAYTSFALTYPLCYSVERDYFKSTLNVLLREGVTLKRGVEVTVRGNIPINSGTSSSSALVIAWTAFLLKMTQDPRAEDPLSIARLAHRAEVVEFEEPGGQMDHFASAFGGLMFIEFKEGLPPQRLSNPLGAFVLGDSCEPKDTTGILARVKGGALEALARLGRNIGDLTPDALEAGRKLLSDEQHQLLRAQLIDRELTREALELLRSEPFDHRRFGLLLYRHHEQLRDGLRISTPKIDRMIDAALKAGALGAKINGSGGGGCMFAYAPQKTEETAEAIRREGGKAYIIRVDDGVRFEN